MKISNELVPITYNISKLVYQRDMTFKDGQKQIVGNNRMNENSAADYINNFRCMMEGNRFTRTLNAFSMEYFFENIYQDFGADGLTNALLALKQHIEYYEGIQKTKVKLHKMRSIYDKYLAAEPITTLDEKEQNEIIKVINETPKSKDDVLKELLNLPEKEDSIVIIKGKAYKRDNKTIAQIKWLHDFKCQICGKTIIKSDGNKYVEAAHIKPKNQRGRETIDNILLLCPNHHKEFDLGNRKIVNHTKTNIEFSVNGQSFNLSFIPNEAGVRQRAEK